MRSVTQRRAVLMAAVVVVVGLAAMAALGGTAAADSHQPEDAPDMTEQANFTVALPFQTDHYPGSQNEENGSIQYWAQGADAFYEQDAEEGVFFEYIEVGADWIDYRACDTENTYAFGIDRGNNNTGVEYDDDLLDHQERSEFHDGGIDIYFFDWDDWYDPPYMAPEDAVVAEQGARSNAGACLHMTDEPGWYQVQSFFNGTVADNGPNERPSDDAEKIGAHLRSTYVYICECDSEAEAEQRLGPKPAPHEEPGGATPTPTPADDGDDEPTPTPTEVPDDTDEPTPTPTEAQNGGGDDTSSNDGGGDEGSGDEGSGDEGGESSDGQDGDDDAAAAGASGGEGMTPTPGEGPGFGAVAALVALLASGLLVTRRR